jgi:sugar-specific transcriptional regulator TrmB
VTRDPHQERPLTHAARQDPGGRHLAEAVAGGVPDSLRREVEELGLSPSESRVLIALLRVGSATSPQLARLSGVPRTNTYQVLEGLAAKRLALRLPGEGPAVWASPGLEEVFRRLEEALTAAQEERLERHRARATRVEELLAETVSEVPAAALPYVHVLYGAGQAKKAYDELLGRAEREIVMFTRSPYTVTVGEPNPAVLQLLARGVDTRVLYQEKEWDDPEAAAFRRETEVYHEAGVRARVVGSLPLKLVVVDRAVALVAMTDPGGRDGFSTALLIEHPGFAELAATAFEQMWQSARPLRAP